MNSINALESLADPTGLASIILLPVFTKTANGPPGRPAPTGHGHPEGEKHPCLQLIVPNGGWVDLTPKKLNPAS